MDRRDFVIALSGIAGIVTFIEACKKEDDSPSSPPAPTGVNFTIDISQSPYTVLKNTGGSVITHGIIIARSSSGFIALSAHCTHAGCNVNFDGNSFPCPCHGSRFAQDGSVMQGPANSPLTKYQTSLTGTMLKVTD